MERGTARRAGLPSSLKAPYFVLTPTVFGSDFMVILFYSILFYGDFSTTFLFTYN